MSRKILTIVAIVVIVFAGGLSAILINQAAGRFNAVSTVPHNVANVSGNGGNAVAVGEYLYFIGNFVNTRDIVYRQNEYNRVTVNDRRHYGGIFRIRLNENGRPSYDNSHIDEPPIDPNNPGSEWNTRVAGKELIVPKIAGHENSAMWIFGNHIVYTSPHNRLDRRGQLQTGRLDFFRVDLDGRNHRRIFTTSESNLTRDNFTVAWGGGHSHLLVVDGQRLVHVGVSQNPGRVTELAESVSSFALPMVTSYFESSLRPDKGFEGVMGFVYWTEDRSEEDREAGIRGNLMRRASLSDIRTTQNLGEDASRIYSLHALSGGRLFFEIAHVLGETQEPTRLFIADRPNIGLFHPSQIRTNFQARDIALSGMTFFGPTEFAGTASLVPGSIPIFGLAANGNIVRFDTQAPDFYGNRFEPRTTPLASGVTEILAVTAGRIHFKVGAEVRVVDWEGQEIRNTEHGRFVNDMPEGSRVTHFTVMPHTSTGDDFVVFFRTLTSNEFETETIINEEGEEEIIESERATKTIAVMMDANGVEWILAVVEEEFI
ncbi:MAG: hypothetical protein FWE31_04565 [Firmicutes bacterium]|nr:hypothetical protein [Bacillota bacterium]